MQWVEQQQRAPLALARNLLVAATVTVGGAVCILLGVRKSISQPSEQGGWANGQAQTFGDQHQEGYGHQEWLDEEQTWRQAVVAVQRAKRQDLGLGPELTLNALLLGANSSQRKEIIAVAWGLRKRRRSILRRVTRCLRCPDSVDMHNKAALCVATAPDLSTASPAELVRIFNRAGVAVPLGLLPANPGVAPDATFTRLRAAAADFLRVNDYFRFTLSILTISDESMAAQAALGLTRLTAPERAFGQQAAARMRQVVARQAERLFAELVDDTSFAAHLPREDRELVLQGGLQPYIEDVVRIVERLIKDEVRRCHRRHDRLWDGMERRQRRSCCGRPDYYAILSY